MIEWQDEALHSSARAGDMKFETRCVRDGREAWTFEAFVRTPEQTVPRDGTGKLAAETFAREWVAKQAAALGDGWIPVEDQLPERGIAVLAVYISPIKSDRRIDLMWHGPKGWHAGGSESITVTHWRPLPPLPVAEVEE